jgi:hypothetical protein
MRVNGPNRADSFVAIEASNSQGVTQRMRVAVDELVPVPEPQMSVRHEQMLGMFLRPGSIELGFRRSEMARLAYGAGEMLLCHRHAERWVRADDTTSHFEPSYF